MKKSLIIALGAIALVACTKTSVSYEQTGEIGFAPVARMNGTKATAIPSTVFPEDWNLKVYGYYDNTIGTGQPYSDGHFTEDYLPGVEFAKNARGATAGYWLGKAHAYYWPKTGSILFAAYAPADYAAATVAHDKVKTHSPLQRWLSLPISPRQWIFCTLHMSNPTTRLLYTCSSRTLSHGLQSRLSLMPRFL